jgi:hypothetical protein
MNPTWSTNRRGARVDLHRRRGDRDCRSAAPIPFPLVGPPRPAVCPQDGGSPACPGRRAARPGASEVRPGCP